jgi:hypothetical protein
VAPQRLGLAVVHDQRRVEQHPRGPEAQHPVTETTVEGDGGVAQRAVGHAHGDITDGVVHDLVPGHDLQRVGTRITGDLEGEHGFAVLEEAHVVGAEEPGFVDRGDAVGGRPSGAQLADVDERRGQLCIGRVVQRGRGLLTRTARHLVDRHGRDVLRSDRP